MNIKNFVLGIGIVVVFALVLGQGIETFYPGPDWEDYCDRNDKGVIVNELECQEVGGIWEYYDEPINERVGHCDIYSECEEEFDGVRDSHAQKVFFISLIVAVLAFILGYSLLKTEPVGSALILSGVWSVFYGTIINWRNFNDIWRFLILLVLLALLIWLALRPSKKKGFWVRFGFG